LPTNIKVLRQQRADLTNEASALFEKAQSEGRNLNAEELARDDAIDQELKALDEQISRTERQMDRQRALGVVTDGNSAAATAAATAAEAPRFNSLGEQMMAVFRAAQPGGQFDPRLSAAGTGMNESVGADGGFLVQTDFQAGLLQNVWDSGEILSRVRRIPVGPNSNGIRMNGVDETSRANGSRSGGIVSYWTGEAQLKTASQPRFKPLKMELDKLTGLCYATDELLQDAVALEAWMQQAFRDEFTFKIEDAILNGTGAGMPLGSLNSGAVITVPKVSGQAAATVNSANILAMWSRMPPRNRANAVWVVNQDTEAQLMQLYMPVRNVAGTENVGGLALPQVVFNPPSNGNSFPTLMGRPVIATEYGATLGTAGDILLIDFSQYLAIDKGGVQSASSIHVRFIYDETCFRFVYRFNGQPIWSQPITPYRGTNTISPFVALATRS
jgi:HK97 family phage major capsid protein